MSKKAKEIVLDWVEEAINQEKNKEVRKLLLFFKKSIKKTR